MTLVISLIIGWCVGHTLSVYLHSFYKFLKKQMKLPKTKTGLFVVSRYENGSDDGCPIGIFVTAEAADNYAGACEQEFKDKGILIYNFRSQYVMFYNE